MELTAKFKLALGILWSLFAIVVAITLLPGIWERRQAWQDRVKRSPAKRHAPGRLQQLIFVPLCGLMSSNVIAQALHKDYYKLTGISSQTLFHLMVLLLILFFLVGYL